MQISELADFFLKFPVEALLYQDNTASALFHEGIGYLVFIDGVSAGAIGEVQGRAILHGLHLLEAASPKALYLWINSAGAHFKEPLSGLLYLNRILEALWQFKTAACPIQVFTNGWLYGGMAMSICTCADAILLTPSAQLHLFGHRAYQSDSKTAMSKGNNPYLSAQKQCPEPFAFTASIDHNIDGGSNDQFDLQALWPDIPPEIRHPPYLKIERVSEKIWWNRLLADVPGH